MAGHPEHVRAAVVLSGEMRWPAPHVVVCGVHDKARLLPTLYVLAGHAEHVRAAVLVSALILKPGAHVGCVMHDVLRWPAGGALQMHGCVALHCLVAPGCELNTRLTFFHAQQPPCLWFPPLLYSSCIWPTGFSLKPAP